MKGVKDTFLYLADTRGIDISERSVRKLEYSLISMKRCLASFAPTVIFYPHAFYY